MANTLALSRETTFGSDGIATIVVGPDIRGESWNIEHVVVATTNEITNPTEAYLYRGSISDSNLIEATIRGNGDHTNTVIKLVSAELLWVQWRDGIAGTRADLRIEGQKEYS